MSCPLCGGEVPPDDLLIREDVGVVVRGDKVARLTKQEMVLFSAMVEIKPRIATYDWLMCRLYDYGATEPAGGVVAVHQRMHKLRAKLKPLGVRIVVAWGVGYIFEHQGHIRRARPGRGVGCDFPG